MFILLLQDLMLKTSTFHDQEKKIMYIYLYSFASTKSAKKKSLLTPDYKRKCIFPLFASILKELRKKSRSMFEKKIS